MATPQGSPPPPPSDDLVAKIILREGRATPEQLESARATQKRMLRDGTQVPLADVLAQLGILSSDRAQDLSRVEHPPDEGKPFGHYRLLGELGGGGMGIVYRAHDPRLNREVALKVIRAESAGEEARARFQREATAMARLRHPNILPVFEVGEADGRPYYTMELIDGESLKDVLSRTKSIPPRAAMRILRDVALGIQHAHDQGIIHRDIKPANIMLTRIGGSDEDEEAGIKAKDSSIQLSTGITSRFRVLVTDFGLARDVAAETRLTQTGDVMGTPFYMSPEQADGDVRRIGPKTDVYSIGATLYEAVCGHPPFEETSVHRLLASIIREEPIALNLRLPALHPDVATICAKAMAKAKERRYATAGEFADDVNRYLKGEIINARPASWTYRLWRRVVRHREIVIPSVAALLVVMGVLAWRPLKEAWAQHVDEVARAGRLRVSNDLLAQARGAFDRGERGEAANLAQRLVSDFGPFGDRGEEHPIPEACSILADVEHERAESASDSEKATIEKNALRWRFKAYCAASAKESGRPFLVGMARELVESARFDEARGILERVLRDRGEDAVVAEARYWLGRCHEGTMSFDAAADCFRQAQVGPLPKGLREACAEHLDVCGLFEGETVLPFKAPFPVGADFDRDGRNELLLTDGKSIRIVSVADDGTPSTRAEIVLPPNPEYVRLTVAASDLDGDGVPEVLAAGGGVDEKGTFSIYRFTGGTLQELSSSDIAGAVEPWPFAVQDLDGNGSPEILLGTSYCHPRTLRIYTWRRNPDRLDLLSTTPMSGDVTRVLVRPASDGQGPLIIVCAGPWGDRAIGSYRWTSDGLRLIQEEPVGVVGTLIRIDEDRGLSLVVGTTWPLPDTHAMLRTLGEKRFRDTYPPAGVYFVRVDADGTVEIKRDKKDAIMGGQWTEPKGGGYAAAAVRSTSHRYLLAGGSSEDWGQNEASRHWMSEATGSLCVLESAGKCKAISRLRLPVQTSLLGSLHWDAYSGIDLDGDSEDEVVCARPSAIRIYGLKHARKTSTVLQDSQAKASEDPGKTSPDRLQVARDAEAVGLWGDALEEFVRVAQSGEDAIMAPEAKKGIHRCLAKLRRLEELVQGCRDAARRWPGRESEFLPFAIDALCEDRRWDLALAMCELYASTSGIGPGDRLELRAKADTLRALAGPPKAITLLGANPPEADTLISSPLFCRRNAAGEMVIWPTSGGTDYLMVPINASWNGLALAGILTLERQDWSTGASLCLMDASPRFLSDTAWVKPEVKDHVFHSLSMSCGGAGNYPRHGCEANVIAHGTLESARFLVGADELLEDLKVLIQHVPYPDRLFLGIGEKSGSHGERVLPAPATGSPNAFAGVMETTGGYGPGLWSRIRLTHLELQTPSPADGLRTYVPHDALDHLLLANGRWVFGRMEEARTFYDLAVELGEAEWPKEERLVKSGLPSRWDDAKSHPAERWVTVDAHLYRGLFRVTQGDRPGGMEDLGRAWDLSSERVGYLVAQHALPLKERAAEAEALRDLWLEKNGDPRGKALDDLVRQTHKNLFEEDEVVDALFGSLGYRVVHHLIVKEVKPEGPAAKAGVRAADEILLCDGQPSTTKTRFQAALIAARDRGEETCHVVLKRGDARIEVEHPTDILGTVFEEAGETSEITREEK